MDVTVSAICYVPFKIVHTLRDLLVDGAKILDLVRKKEVPPNHLYDLLEPE